MISELKKMEHKSGFCATLLCTNFSLATSKAGKAYLSFTAQDDEGIINVKKWEHPENTLPVNGVYELSGTVDVYKDERQLNVKSVVHRPDLSVTDYVIKLLSDIEVIEYAQKMRELIKLIEDNSIREVVQTIYEDLGLYEVDIRQTPLYTTAALRWHHVGLGGFLMHTVTTALKAYNLANGCYGSINKSLVLGGSLLHDIGKVFTYKIQDGGFTVTTRGENLDHLVLGITHLERYRNSMNSSVVTALQSIICGHHQLPEYGSPKTPNSVESWIVTFADQLDCKEFLVVHRQDEGVEAAEIVRVAPGQYMYTPYGLGKMITSLEDEFAEVYFLNNYAVRRSELGGHYPSEEGKRMSSVQGMFHGVVS